VGRVLVALGVGFVTYKGLDVTTSYLKTQALDALTGLPSVAVGMLGVMQVGTAINIIVSAIAVRMLLSGVANGSLRKLTQK
jgi:ABC-type phosphate transport system permease subunit